MYKSITDEEYKEASEKLLEYIDDTLYDLARGVESLILGKQILEGDYTREMTDVQIGSLAYYTNVREDDVKLVFEYIEEKQNPTPCFDNRKFWYGRK